MNADHDEFARKIVHALDTGARNLGDQTTARLRAAREQALAEYRPASSWSLASAGQAVIHWVEHPGAGLRYLLPAAALIVGLAGIVYWQSGNGGVNELADMDARLLTDDLPIDAYLDKGFDSWLKRQSR